MPSPVSAATANSPSSSAAAPTAQHAGSSASAPSQALAHPGGGRFISPVVPEFTVFPACELCRSLRGCSFDVAFHFTALFPTMEHLQTDSAAVKRPKLLVLGAGRRRPTQLSLGEASEGQMELPYGRQESCRLYANTHTPTPQIHFQLVHSRGAGSYDRRHEVQI